MKLIIKIAKNELRHLFYTPVAWFLLILFWTLCAVFYVEDMYPAAIRMYNALSELPEIKYLSTLTLTMGITKSGLFDKLLQYLYLFVPLLTMGVISREFNTGTSRLLYSSPLRLRQLVIGKYLGVCVFNFLFLLILTVFSVTATFDIKSADTGVLISAGIGVYLLLSAYAAIGVFASSLTRYPIVAALISFTILGIMSSIGNLWQEYDVVRDLTYFLSLAKRVDRMTGGLLTTKDISYFLLVIIMFVSFTLLVLKNKMLSSNRYIKIGRFAGVAAAVLILGYLSSRQSLVGYLDTSARKINTLHPKTQENLKTLSAGPLEVILYTNLFGDADQANEQYIGFPKNINNYLSLWEPYLRFKKDISFKYVYYYAVRPGDRSIYSIFPGKTLQQIAGLTARMVGVDSSLFMSPEEVQKVVDLNKIDYGVGLQLRWQDQSIFVDYFPTPTGVSRFMGPRSSSEPAYNASFLRLHGNKMPKLGFVTGQLERSILKTGEREYSWLNSLYALGFDIDTINLSTQQIPSDISELILADPRQELSSVVKEKIKNYLESGGNMFILGEPGKQYVLNPILESLGVKLKDGQLVEYSRHESADKISTFKMPESYLLANEFLNVGQQNYMKHLGRRLPPGDTIFTSFVGTASLGYDTTYGFSVTPLLMTRPGKSWKKMEKLVSDSTFPAFNTAEGDVSETSFPVALQLTRQINNKEQRLVITGDADFQSRLRIPNDEEFPRSIFSWLNYNNFPVYTDFPLPMDNILVLTPARARAEKIIYIWVIPTLLLLTAIVLLTRRKRQ